MSKQSQPTHSAGYFAISPAVASVSVCELNVKQNGSIDQYIKAQTRSFSVI